MAKNSDTLLKANLKLQIRNLENQLGISLDKWKAAVDEVDEIEEKIVHLESKLYKLEKSTGKNKKQESQKR